MKIGIYGGAFDPIHIGHIAVINRVLNELDEVWVMPTYKSMFGKKMTDGDHRLIMCKFALQEISKARVFDFEIRLRLTGPSYEIVRKIFTAYPQHEFYFIIGQDNANKFDEWAHHDQLLSLMVFFVVGRPGVAIQKDAWYTTGKHIYLEDRTFLVDVSSTQIRNDFEHNIDKVDFDVSRYIIQHGIY